MGMRITTSMMMNTYRYNLQNSTGNLSSARDKVLSQRKFTSYAEDPGSATQAWRIRRAMSRNFDYQLNNSDTYSRFNIAWTTMGVINYDLADLDGKFSTIRGENGAIGAGRQPLGQVLSESAETIIQAMNSAKYGDHYVFSGDDEMNPPFTWSADHKTLYYRGVNVGAGTVQMPNKPEWMYQIEAGANPEDVMPAYVDEPATADEAWQNAWIQYYNDQQKLPPSWTQDPLDPETGTPVGMPSEGKTPEEQAWIDYYKDQARTKPDWALGPLDENGMPVNMPESPVNSVEREWVAYYEQLAAYKAGELDTPPTEPPGPEGVPKPDTGYVGYAEPQIVPSWVNSERDGAGVPKEMPPSEKQTDWEKLWATYVEDAYAGKSPTKPSEELNIDPSEIYPEKWGEPDQVGIPENIRKILDGTMTDEDGNPIPCSEYDRAWAEYYLDRGDVKKLEMMAAEDQFVDLGMGLQEDVNNVMVNGTAFNRSLPGINMLGGFGVDEDGDPKNIVLIMKRLGELFSESDPNSGEWAHEGDEEEAMRLMDKLTAAHHRTTEAYTEIETRAHFLQNNQTRLETQGDYLQEERIELEQVDLADAITEFSWDYYCYSAALKIGTQLLSQSLIDYMG